MTGAGLPDHRTLPEWLRRRAEREGSAPALRYKRRGQWLEQSWSALAASVATAAAAWRAHGFSAGDRLRVDAPPVPDVFRHCLAAWWLGGSVAVHGPEATATPPVEAARFALAGDEAARARLDAAQPALAPYTLGVQLEGSAALASASWRTSGVLATPRTIREPAETGDAVALVRYADRSRSTSGAERRSVTHAELVDGARALFERDAVGTRALAGCALSLGAQLETVLGAWLVSGFTLGFVEAESTEHGDRRELEPNLLFDTADGYAQLAARIQASLPPLESRERRWLDRALDGTPRLGRRLITRRLRAVVGFGGARRALLVGGAPNTSGLERLLDIPVLVWPPRKAWRSEDVAEPSTAAIGALELARTGSDVA